MKNVLFWKGATQVRQTAVQVRNSFGRPVDWHSHPFYELAFVFSGESDWRADSPSGRRIHETVAAGEVLLLPPNALHTEEIRLGREARIGWIGFDNTVPPPLWCWRPIPLGEDRDEVFQLFNTVYHEHSRPGNRDRIRLVVQMLLLLVARQVEGSAATSPGIAEAKSGLNPRQARCIEAAAYTLRNNLKSPLEIAQVAAFHSFSPAYFSTLFRRHFRISPRLFLQQARVEKAAELLSGSDLTIKEIAAETGFADSAHLCKTFRTVKEITPGAYRAAASTDKLPAIVLA